MVQTSGVGPTATILVLDVQICLTWSPSQHSMHRYKDMFIGRIGSFGVFEHVDRISEPWTVRRMDCGTARGAVAVFATLSVQWAVKQPLNSSHIITIFPVTSRSSNTLSFLLLIHRNLDALEFLLRILLIPLPSHKQLIVFLY